jgi:hypothetical protein
MSIMSNSLRNCMDGTTYRRQEAEVGVLAVPQQSRMLLSLLLLHVVRFRHLALP